MPTACWVHVSKWSVERETFESTMARSAVKPTSCRSNSISESPPPFGDSMVLCLKDLPPSKDRHSCTPVPPLVTTKMRLAWSTSRPGSAKSESGVTGWAIHVKLPFGDPARTAGAATIARRLTMTTAAAVVGARLAAADLLAVDLGLVGEDDHPVVANLDEPAGDVGRRVAAD